MTVKEIFALRKQGKIEEAYDAIRPIYREHKGKYTTLCMFWTAADVFKLRLEQKRIEEAEKIYKDLQRLILSIEDDEKQSAVRFMHYAESRLIHASEKFRKRYFAMRDKKKRVDIPSDNPSEDPIIPSAPPLEVALSKGQQAVLECIKAHPGLKVPGIETETGIPVKSIERHVSALIARNLIEHRGSKKTGGYHALDSTFRRLLPQGRKK